MRRKWMLLLPGTLLAAGLLAGCAKTPENSVVKQKGVASLKNYEEADAAQTESQGTQSVEGENPGTEAGAENGAESPLAAALQAPKRYQSEIQDETGRLQVLTDAEVVVPNAEKASVISVTRHPFDQAVIDRVTEAFFPGAKIYSGDSYSRLTKSDYQERIEELEGYVAEGNLDPYSLGTDEEGNLYYDIYREIELYREAYQEAPEEKVLEEVHPQFGLTADDGKGGTYVQDSYFYGVAQMPEGDLYHYRMKYYSSMPMDIHITKSGEQETSPDSRQWLPYETAKASSGENEVPDQKELEQEIGISMEDALAIAKEKVEKLEIPEMELADWEYGICYERNMGISRGDSVAAGYMFYFSRNIGGIPITATADFGGALEDMDSEMETWGYEKLDITVSKEGIEEVVFLNQYDLGEVKTENVKLLPFEEIVDIYEKMMLIQNADVLTYEKERTYHIDRITFGYSRIYDPSTSSTTGMLVPVWDFFGSFEGTAEWDGETQEYASDGTIQSYLTINAVDGSMIDRGLGY